MCTVQPAQLRAVERQPPPRAATSAALLLQPPGTGSVAMTPLCTTARAAPWRRPPRHHTERRQPVAVLTAAGDGDAVAGSPPEAAQPPTSGLTKPRRTSFIPPTFDEWHQEANGGGDSTWAAVASTPAAAPISPLGAPSAPAGGVGAAGAASQQPSSAAPAAASMGRGADRQHAAGLAVSPGRGRGPGPRPGRAPGRGRGAGRGAVGPDDGLYGKYTPQRLAYIGDAIWSLHVRGRYLLPPKAFAKYRATAEAHVTAAQQASYLSRLMASQQLAPLETRLVAWARRAEGLVFRAKFSPASGQRDVYRLATAFEALVGYLSLEDGPRMLQLFQLLGPYMDEHDQRGERQ